MQEDFNCSSPWSCLPMSKSVQLFFTSLFGLLSVLFCPWQVYFHIAYILLFSSPSYKSKKSISNRQQRRLTIIWGWLVSSHSLIIRSLFIFTSLIISCKLASVYTCRREILLARASLPKSISTLTSSVPLPSNTLFQSNINQKQESMKYNRKYLEIE